MQNWYVYRHFKKGTLECFYVGIGSRPYRKVQPHNRNIFWKRIVEKYGFDYEVVAIQLTHEKACELEIFMIAEYGRRCDRTGCLTNLTFGGDGSSGLKISEETRKKLKNRRASEETKAKMREKRKGYKHSPETILKMKLAANRPESKLRISILHKGKKRSEECLKKQRLKQKGRIITQQAREKLRRHNLGKKASDETKLKMSLSRIGKKQSKETREKRSRTIKLQKQAICHSSQLSLF